MPRHYIGQPIKKNFPMSVLMFFSFCILFIAGPRIKLYRKREEEKDRMGAKITNISAAR